MIKKTCSKCKKEKYLTRFGFNKSTNDGRNYQCKNCRIEYYNKNRESIRSRKRKWAMENKESIKNRQAIDRKKYSESPEIRKEKKDKVYAWRKKKFGANQELKRKKRELQIEEQLYRKKNRFYNKKYLTPYKKKFRNFIWFGFNKDKFYKNSELIKVIGCEFIFFKAFIGSQFVKGMTWENKGEWETDHIIPLSSANTLGELKKLCHYSNTQPLWKEENHKKSNKVPLVTNLYYHKQDIRL